MSSREIVAAIVQEILDPKATGDLYDDVTEAIMADLGDARIPAPGESAAVALRSPKTTALVFDRVWASSPLIPHDISFFGDTPFETAYLALMTMMLGMAQAEEDKELVPVVDDLRGRWSHVFAHLVLPEEDSFRGTRSAVTRRTCEWVAAKYSIPVTAVYDREVTRAKEYVAGDRSALVAIVENMAVISEAELSWEQVGEFRRDHEARRAIRRMLHWLDRDFVGKSVSFIEDEVAIRLDAYDRATRRHGIRTVTGSLSALLDSQFLAAGALATGVVGYMTGGLGALIAGATLSVAKVSLQVANVLLDTSELTENAAGDIAFVIQARNVSRASAT